MVRRSRAVRAPGPEPPGRAARASSSSRSRRAWCDMARGVCPHAAEPCNHFPMDRVPTDRSLVLAIADGPWGPGPHRRRRRAASWRWRCSSTAEAFAADLDAAAPGLGRADRQARRRAPRGTSPSGRATRVEAFLAGEPVALDDDPDRPRATGRHGTGWSSRACARSRGARSPATARWRGGSAGPGAARAVGGSVGRNPVGPARPVPPGHRRRRLARRLRRGGVGRARGGAGRQAGAARARGRRSSADGAGVGCATPPV